MGEFLMHSSVVWLNPHPSLGRMRKEPEMTVFGESGRCGIVIVAYLPKSKAKISALSLSLTVIFVSTHTERPDVGLRCRQFDV